LHPIAGTARTVKRRTRVRRGMNRDPIGTSRAAELPAHGDPPGSGTNGFPVASFRRCPAQDDTSVAWSRLSEPANSLGRIEFIAVPSYRLVEGTYPWVAWAGRYRPLAVVRLCASSRCLGLRGSVPIFRHTGAGGRDPRSNLVIKRRFDRRGHSRASPQLIPDRIKKQASQLAYPDSIIV
jgi:hypothetical protein